MTDIPVELFDFSLIRCELKQVFRKAGIDVPSIYAHLSQPHKAEIPFEEVQRWFHQTTDRKGLVDIVPKRHVALFMEASIRAIDALAGKVTDIDLERMGGTHSSSGAVCRQFTPPRVLR